MERWGRLWTEAFAVRVMLMKREMMYQLMSPASLPSPTKFKANRPSIDNIIIINSMFFFVASFALATHCFNTMKIRRKCQAMSKLYEYCDWYTINWLVNSLRSQRIVQKIVILVRLRSTLHWCCHLSNNQTLFEKKQLYLYE